MADGSVAKVCAACAKDVSTLPRTKDGQGRYFCQECAAKLKAKQTQQAAAKPAGTPQKAGAKVAAAVPSETDLLSKMLADSPGVEMCPNCGTGVQVGSKICIRCGFNRETGKAMKVQVELAPKDKGERSAAGKNIGNAYLALADGPLGWLFAAGGALIGGLIGAGAYSYTMTSSGYEVYPIAALVGILAGACGWVTVRWSASTSHGVIAALIAVGCIIGGRYFAVSQKVDEMVEQMTRSIKIEDTDIIAMVARDVAQEFSSQGKNYQWPEESDPVSAWDESEFPKPIWDEAATRFTTMSDSAKEAKKAVAEAEFKRNIEEFKEEAANYAFTETLNQTSTSAGFRGIRKRSAWRAFIWWVVIGTSLAFGIGSGFNNPFND